MAVLQRASVEDHNIHIHLSEEEDQDGMLPMYMAGQALSSWDATDNGTNNLSTDFCRWNGIACNDRRHPGRVTAIRLRGSDLGGTISPHIEYGSGYGVSTDGDIYSYGVLLLEMLTGKRPTDSFDHGTSLVSYVKMAYPNKLLEILDVSATYSGNTQDVIDLVIHPMFGIALACCQDSPRQRIKMDYVVEELKAIKKACAALMGS
ncbi:probable LRR receptor-like serine/threonine-protein kinase At3g47570 [Setaria italica]|uniref:probable LRR receptor-like serine/threonine-protein kinase At3g47570 n=1 Tax=Setaria italica TaxID=4555 RepID=UPI000BE5D186|nr:probable LRR receptor-like serine/threonine-protein kinase At3g47570 [Setaria italica]